MFPFQKIHLFGAPGAGVSSLGKALATQLGYVHLDVDDFYWFTGDPLPYKRKRNPEHRRSMLASELQRHPDWVLSGSLCGWGDVFIPYFDLVIFCRLDTTLRLERIAGREKARYGERVLPGGDLHTVYEKFCRWAADYDTAENNIRALKAETAWLQELSQPYVEMDMEAPVGELVERVLSIR